MMRILLLWWVCSSSLFMPFVEAWGKVGHEAIANVAWTMLDSSTQSAIQQVIEGSAEPSVRSHCVAPCSPLAQVADWADMARYSKPYHYTSTLHYIDIQDQQLPQACFHTTNTTNSSSMGNSNDDCGFVWDRDCVHDQCVAGAVWNYTHQLLTSNHAQAQKVALLFTTHFIGDIHQPLHVARQSDKGGNTIHVTVQNWTTKRQEPKYSPPRGRHVVHQQLRHSHGLNLHAVWDSTLIETYLDLHTSPNRSAWSSFWMQHDYDRSILEEAMHEWIQEQQHHTNLTTTTCLDGWQNRSCVSAWARESWTLARRHAYVHVANHSAIRTHDALPVPYYQENWPLVLQQLSAAAVRLAATLTSIFSATATDQWSELERNTATP